MDHARISDMGLSHLLKKLFPSAPFAPSVYLPLLSILLLCLFSHISVGRADTVRPNQEPGIDRIEIEGNEKTIPEVIKRELIIEPGDEFDAIKIETSRQNIMDLGLFHSVKARSRKTPEGIEVTFVVDEKRFWYFVPLFSRGSDGDITWGVRLQMDNLFGKNNELTVRAKRKDFEDTDIQVEKTLEVGYRYPRIFGSQYDLQLDFDYDEADIEEERDNLRGDYLREKVSYGLSIAKWITTSGPSKGLRASLGFRSDDFDHTFLRGDPNLFSNVTVNSLVFGMENINVEDKGLYRNGRHYGLYSEFASLAIGSDISHTSHNIFYRRYRSLNPDKRSNFNFQIRAGAISSSVFGDATYSITSGSTVRGYARDSIEGNAFYYTNIEYLRGVPGKETLRAAAFIDGGDAFDRLSDFSFSDPKVGIGVGFRWKIRSFVRTDLRIDIAHGLGNSGETRVYAGTRATF